MTTGGLRTGERVCVPECVLRVSVPGTGRGHRRIAPAGAVGRALARWRARRAVGPLAPSKPGGPAPGLVPPGPVPPGSWR